AILPPARAANAGGVHRQANNTVLLLKLLNKKVRVSPHVAPLGVVASYRPLRFERLQAITLGDICKEIGCGLYDFRPATYGFQVWEELWKSIYGEENWQANPWVWVIEFKVVPNVQDNPA
ncbi:hypothetical protein ACUOA8_23100, partial [Escherichia sp. SS-MK2]